ncbi:MAG: WD40 repeat domain-containing protein [Verrucomicrobia bacterium]|nr:WD40 repeat domain-containing protein [Verrucomicrobiota bacterium]
MRTPKRKLIKTSFDARFSPNGQLLASLSRDIVLWSCPDTKKIWKAHPFSHPSYVAFSPDSSLLVVKSTSGDRCLLSCTAGDVISDFKGQSHGEGGNLLFAEDGESIVDGSWSGWHSVLTIKGEILFEEHFANEMVTGILRHPDGKFWFRHQRRGTDPQDGSPTQYLIGRTFPFSRGDFQKIPIPFYSYQGASFSPNGQVLAILSGHNPNVLSVFEFPTMQFVKKTELPAAFRLGCCLRYSPNGDIIAVISSTLLVCLAAKDLSIQSCREIPRGCSIDFSPTGSHLVVGSWSVGEVFSVEEVTKSQIVPIDPEKVDQA